MPSMIVISRKKNESIIINDDITIVVVEIRGDKVRLGIETPKEIPVHRNEVYDAIRRLQFERDDTKASEQKATESAGDPLAPIESMSSAPAPPKERPQQFSGSPHITPSRPPEIAELQAEIQSLRRKVADQSAIIGGFLLELNERGELERLPKSLEHFVPNEVLDLIAAPKKSSSPK
jgi:carbon storage regulator